jgi:hypothetical protein
MTIMMMQNTRTLSAQILTFNTLPTLLFEAVKGSKPAVGSTLITAENRLASSFFPAKSVVVQFKPLNKTRVKSSIQIRKEVIVSTTAISS